MKRDHGRFVPGESGNPKGRPAFSIVSIIKAKLQSVPRGQHRSVAEAMIADYIADAQERNDGVAIRDIIDRFDGKPKQHIRMDNHLDGAWGEYLNSVARTEPEAGEHTTSVLEDEPEDTDTGRRRSFGEDGS